ncbi:hypothetical protein [Gloeothece verrucosa]|uniref:Helix-turn-helix domain-containing protein n=1 Tax=Gloeothece verrucosa (strain PCC 7822) TaxID=497965 RepID=E0UCB8_GLOV7|nr:hypothetical protein [Gloeothece verrucosa]ADN12875.1 hypothetical protein Cyan7822_0855 [Gloeothece verrucosa PCC 7822]
MAQTNWVKTSEAANKLGVTPVLLRRMLGKGLFKKGKHYRNISINQARPTYRWNIDKLEKFFDEVVL